MLPLLLPASSTHHTLTRRLTAASAEHGAASAVQAGGASANGPQGWQPVPRSAVASGPTCPLPVAVSPGSAATHPLAALPSAPGWSPISSSLVLAPLEWSLSLAATLPLEVFCCSAGFACCIHFNWHGLKHSLPSSSTSHRLSKRECCMATALSVLPGRRAAMAAHLTRPLGWEGKRQCRPG